MTDLAHKLKGIARQYVGKPYICSRPEMACIFLVLDILASLSAEFAAIRGRLKCLEITASKRTLIRGDYFYKFINTTRLKLTQVAENTRLELQPGDVLLINKKAAAGRVDHLGLYLGQGKAILLDTEHQVNTANILQLKDIQGKLKAIARGEIDG